ncbi:uncharacterized protein LOC108950185 [Ciona intestinalis]
MVFTIVNVLPRISEQDQDKCVLNCTFNFTKLYCCSSSSTMFCSSKICTQHGTDVFWVILGFAVTLAIIASLAVIARCSGSLKRKLCCKLGRGNYQPNLIPNVVFNQSNKCKDAIGGVFKQNDLPYQVE